MGTKACSTWVLPEYSIWSSRQNCVVWWPPLSWGSTWAISKGYEPQDKAKYKNRNTKKEHQEKPVYIRHRVLAYGFILEEWKYCFNDCQDPISKAWHKASWLFSCHNPPIYDDCLDWNKLYLTQWSKAILLHPPWAVLPLGLVDCDFDKMKINIWKWQYIFCRCNSKISIGAGNLAKIYLSQLWLAWLVVYRRYMIEKKSMANKLALIGPNMTKCLFLSQLKSYDKLHFKCAKIS